MKYLLEEMPYLEDELDLFPYVSNAASDIAFKRAKLNPFFKRMWEIQSKRNYLYTSQTLFANTLLCLLTVCAVFYNQTFTEKHLSRVYCLTPFKFKNGFGYHYLSSRLKETDITKLSLSVRRKGRKDAGKFVQPSLSCLFALCMGTAEAFALPQGSLLEEVCLRFAEIGDYPEVMFAEHVIEKRLLERCNAWKAAIESSIWP